MKIDENSSVVVMAADGTISVNGVSFRCLASVQGAYSAGLRDIQWRPDLWKPPSRGHYSSNDGASEFDDFAVMAPFVAAWLKAKAAYDADEAKKKAAEEAEQEANRQRDDQMDRGLAPLTALYSELNDIDATIYRAMTQDLVSRGLLAQSLVDRRNDLRRQIDQIHIQHLTVKQ